MLDEPSRRPTDCPRVTIGLFADESTLTAERRRREANKAARAAQRERLTIPDRIQGLKMLISEQYEQQADRGVRRLHESADIKRLRAEIVALESVLKRQ